MENNELLNHREKVYWKITDTILQVKGLEPKIQYEVLCANLENICEAHTSFLFSYDYESSILALLSAHSNIKEQKRLKAIPNIKIKTGSNIFDSFRYRNIQHTSKINILDLIKDEIEKTTDIRIDLIEKENKGYAISALRENRYLITGQVYISKGKRLRMMDLIGAYINMAGMIIQESQSVKEILAKNKQLKNARNRLERQKTELVLKSRQLEEVNEQLKELNSTKDKFFSIIAHDLKNPFNYIMGFSQVIMENYKNLPKEKFEQYLNNIYTSSKNTFSLLQNLLQWARTQTNTIQFEPTVINIKGLVEDTFQLVMENAQKKSVRLIHNLDDDMICIGDINMLNTVVRNLITNAIKFTPENGKITVSAEKRKDVIIISIIDTGIGMSKEDQQKLFRIDTSFSKTGTSGETGTGLGLLLCKEFIGKHQGEIWVSSKPGEGTTFSFSISAKK